VKASWLFLIVFSFLPTYQTINIYRQMANISILLLATEKPGGLFDLDGTLVLVAIQFLALMVVLDLILYTPLLNVINERNQYINKNLANASNKISESNQLIKYFEEELSKARRNKLAEISTSEKLYKAILDIQSKSSQKIFEKFLANFTAELEENKKEVLPSLKGEIQTLINQVTSKILA
jgi:F-type H+-transporting ATPase subunit b